MHVCAHTHTSLRRYSPLSITHCIFFIPLFYFIHSWNGALFKVADTCCLILKSRYSPITVVHPPLMRYSAGFLPQLWNWSYRCKIPVIFNPKICVRLEKAHMSWALFCSFSTLPHFLSYSLHASSPPPLLSSLSSSALLSFSLILFLICLPVSSSTCGNCHYMLWRIGSLHAYEPLSFSLSLSCFPGSHTLRWRDNTSSR